MRSDKNGSWEHPGRNKWIRKLADFVFASSDEFGEGSRTQWKAARAAGGGGHVGVVLASPRDRGIAPGAIGDGGGYG